MRIISLSLQTPNARKTRNNGNGVRNVGISTTISLLCATNATMFNETASALAIEDAADAAADDRILVE